MKKVLVVLVLALAYFIIDMPVNYTVQVDGVETTVLLADGGCSDYYKDEDGVFKKKGAKGVPEPTILMLVVAGMAGVGLYRKFGGKR